MPIFNRKKKNVSLEKHPQTRIGLALGGGGARGYTHLGVLKVFEEYGLKFDYVAGTSVGSMIGALYAAGWNYQKIYHVAKDIDLKTIKPSGIFGLLPSKTDGIEKIIKSALGDVKIEDLAIPFAAVAVDLKTTKEHILTKGNLAKSVAASCAVPGVFQPVAIDNLLLCDGGLSNNLPASVPKRMGCDYVVAVDVNPGRLYGTESSKILDVLSCTIRILMKGSTAKGFLYADHIIEPNTKRFRSTKNDNYEEMIEEGYRAAIAAMPEILALFQKKPVKQKIKNKFEDDAVVV